MIKSEIEKRKIPSLPDIADTDERQRYMKQILSSEEYGNPIPLPDSMSFEVKHLENENYMAGKASLDEVTVTVELNAKKHSFPFKLVYRNGVKKQKPIVHINFRYDFPDKYLPAEELIDRGYAVAQFCYNDVTKDNSDFTHGLAGLIFPDGKRDYPSAPGKLMMWAWAAGRVLDYLETLDFLDLDNAAVAGHSRLGKTALVTAAYDQRFKFAHSNDSGCGGGAIFRDKRGETVKDMVPKLEYWFCPAYAKYVENEHSMPFDQHWLVASAAPRYVEIGTAVEDVWADHESEYLTCVLASEEYERQGVDGFAHPDRYPELHEHMNNGRISYYVRDGKHFFSRYDWNKFMDFIDLKTGNSK